MYASSACNYCFTIHIFKLPLSFPFTKINIQGFILDQDKSNMTALCSTMPWGGQVKGTLHQIMTPLLCIVYCAFIVSSKHKHTQYFT